ncbi:hypothetical protein KI387_019377, partial [Taxus chinensis]
MVSVKKFDLQWMPNVVCELEIEPILVTMRAKAARNKEILKQILLVTREEMVNGKYPDPFHQKYIYQETMHVIRILQGEIQCLKEHSRKLEKNNSTEAPQKDLDEFRE